MKSSSKRKRIVSDVPTSKMKAEVKKVNCSEKMEETVNVTKNNFEETVVGAFKSLEEDTHFTDVTLACVDGQVPFFRFNCKLFLKYFLR